METENLLRRNSFSVTTENLTQTGQDKFAFNITADFPGTEQYENDTKIQSQKKTTVLVDITQEDFYDSQNEIINLMRHVNESNYPFSVSFLFTALDDSDSLMNPTLSGTASWLQNTEETEYITALTVSVEENRYITEILTGGKGRATPLWLIQSLEKSFREERIPVRLPNFFLSLYRAGLIKGDAKTQIFFDAAIPCAKVSLSSPENFSAIQNFLDNYTADDTENWDNHYTFFKLPYQIGTIWAGERTLFLCLEVFSILSILIICTFSFTGLHRARYINDFKKSWFMIPLTILVSFTTLIIGQFFCGMIPFIQNSNPVIQFGSKLIISMIFISILFAFQEYLRIPVAPFIYGYILSLIAVANIFIFSMIDITFFILFGIEYFIVSITKSAKKMRSLVTATFLMLIPFMPYALTIIRYAPPQDMRIFVFSTPLFNILLSLGLFPFQIMWLRILVRLNIFNATVIFSIRKFIVNTILSMGAIIMLIIAVLFIITEFVYKADRNQNNQILIRESDSGNISVSNTYDDFLGMTTHHLTISSEREVLRYQISLSSADSVPVYDSTYEYTVSENSRTATFMIPDYPPEQITIDYISQSESPSTLNVYAFYSTEDKNVFERESFSTEIKDNP